LHNRSLKEALIKSFDKLRTNSKVLIPFVVSLPNALLSLSKGMNGINLIRASLTADRALIVLVLEG